jgi:hypothetical protein
MRSVPRLYNESMSCPLVREDSNSNIRKKKYLVMGPRRVLDPKTYWLTDRQSQYDFDFDLEIDRVSWNIAAAGVTVKFARVEAGSNTSTVTLRVVGGDE